MSALRRALVALAALVAQGGAIAQSPPADSALWLRAPAQPQVTWRGMLATEGGAVGSGVQIGPYVVPGPAGLLAAIFTHAAIQNGVSASARQREQQEADRVLEPYRAALQAWPAEALWQAAAAGSPLVLWAGVGAAPAGTVVDAAPLFTMAQDEGVLLLDVAVRRAGAAGAAAETVVRVVSSPLPLQPATELASATAAPSASAASAASPAVAAAAPPQRQHWVADDARALKRTAAAMFAHALVLALRHAGPDEAELPMRTHRYIQGGQQRSERARQLSGNCQRAVLRTLRGALISVPLPPSAECAVQAEF